MVIASKIWAYFVRDWRTARSYRLAWWLELTSGTFQVFMFYFISRLVTLPDYGGNNGQSIEYFEFVVIGLAIYSFLITGIGIFSSSLRIEQATGTLEVLLAMPTAPPVTIFGVAIYELVRSMLMALTMILISATFFGLRIVIEPVPLLFAFVTLLASFALFASLGITIAAVTIVLKQTSSLVGIVTQSIGLLSGVFYPLELLPYPLQVIGGLIPVTWTLDVLRNALLLGETPIAPFMALLVLSVIAIPGAFALLQIAVNRARYEGSLAHY